MIFRFISLFCVALLMGVSNLQAQSNGTKAFFVSGVDASSDLFFSKLFLAFGNKIALGSAEGKLIIFEEGSGFSEVTIPLAAGASKAYISSFNTDKDGNLYILGFFLLENGKDVVDYLKVYSSTGQWTDITLTSNLSFVGPFAVLSNGAFLFAVRESLTPGGSKVRDFIYWYNGTDGQEVVGTEIPSESPGSWNFGTGNGKDQAIFASGADGQIVLVESDLTVTRYNLQNFIRAISYDSLGQFRYIRDSGKDGFEDRPCFGVFSVANGKREFCDFGLLGREYEYSTLGSDGYIWNSNNGRFVVRVGLSENAILSGVVVPNRKKIDPNPRFGPMTRDANGKFWILSLTTKRELFYLRLDRIPKEFSIRLKRLRKSSTEITYKAQIKTEGGIYDMYNDRALINIMIYNSQDSTFDENDTVIREKRIAIFPLSKAVTRNIFSVKIPRAQGTKFICVDCGPDLPFEVRKKRTVRLQ